MEIDEVLLEALKVRIQGDIPAKQFDEDTWNKTRLGLFYPANDSLVQHMRIATALRSAFEPVLNENGFPMTEKKWDIYFFGVTVNSTPDTAVERMMKVAPLDD